MFGRLFQKRSVPSEKIESVFPVNSREYADFVSGMVRAADSATLAMSAVAYENLQPAIGALETVSSTGSVDVDKLLAAAYRQMDVSASDPINSRRWTWFAMALHLVRLDRMAEANPSLRRQAAANWLLVADAGKSIPKLLEWNEVWKPEEKIWFNETKIEKDGIEYVLLFMMPRIYRADQLVRLFADRHDIILL
ncbi:MAG: hypothetical protein ABL907_13805 [Hyphomicrobium sp.]